MTNDTDNSGKNNRCRDLVTEMERCHGVLDAAGIPPMYDQQDRLYQRVSHIASRYTASGTDLDTLIEELRAYVENSEEDTLNGDTED